MKIQLARSIWKETNIILNYRLALKYGDLEGLKWLLERGNSQKLDLERTYGLVYRGEGGMKKAFQDIVRKFDSEIFGSLGPEFVKFFCTQFGEYVETHLDC